MKYAKSLAAGAVWFIITGCNNDQTIRTYDEFEIAVNSLESEERYEEAIGLTHRTRKQLPEHEFTFIKELEYLNGKTGRYKENLDLWKEGHERGYFFLLNTRLPRFEPYLQFPQFDSLAATDARLRAEALKTSKTIYSTRLPDDYHEDSCYPLLILLHGGGSSLEKAQERWRLLNVMKAGYIVVFLQSYLHYDSESFGWRSGDTRAREDVSRIYRDLVSELAVDTSRIILGGTSAGGTMAFDLAFRKIIPVEGVIGFCPGRPAGLEMRDLSGSRVRVYMLGGETDFYLDRQKELAALFDDAGIPYIHTVVPGMGHEFPDHYQRFMSAALEYISGNGDR
ncbi:alpha/beta fold hydrolase [bacterium]|nr:alpha/beta fold hydrolase [bacterium]